MVPQHVPFANICKHTLYIIYIYTYIYISPILGTFWRHWAYTLCIPISLSRWCVECSDFVSWASHWAAQEYSRSRWDGDWASMFWEELGRWQACSDPVWQENPDHQTWWAFQGFVSWPKALISWFLKKYWSLPPKIDHHVPHWNWMSYQCLETFTWRSTRNEPHKPLLHISDCFIACLAMLDGQNLSQVEMVRNLQLTGYLSTYIYYVNCCRFCFLHGTLYSSRGSPVTTICVLPRICCCYLQRREAQAWISSAPIAWFFSILNLGETCGKWLRDELHDECWVTQNGNRFPKNLGISGCCMLKNRIWQGGEKLRGFDLPWGLESSKWCAGGLKGWEAPIHRFDEVAGIVDVW